MSTIRAPLVLFVVALAACAPAEFPADAPLPASTTPFDADYRAAADEFDVPAPIVRAIGFAQTEHHAVTDSHAGQFGVMGLQEEAIAEAASLLGIEADAIRTETRANVRAAAALVAARRSEGLSWYAAAVAVPALPDEALRARWLRKLARDLKRQGALAWIESLPPEQATLSFAPAEYPGADFVAAYGGNYTNASRGLDDLTYVIIHDVEGSYEGCISWFQNPAAQVSAHYVVSNEGNVTQMVSEADIAWHAGNWTYNQKSVGIEHEGYMSDPNSYPDPMMQASAALTRYLTDKYAIPRDRDHIIEHKEVPGSTHVDPGPYWDWEQYMELIEGDVAMTAMLVGYVREGDIYEGPPIAGARVSIGNGRSTTTDADGYYEFDELDLGLYEVHVTADGYEPATDTKEVDTGGTFWKSVALTPAGEDDVGDDSRRSLPGGCSVGVGSGAAAPRSGAWLAAALLVGFALRGARSLRARA